MTFTLTSEALADLRDNAEERVRMGGFASGDVWIEECPPAVVLALLDRIKELEEHATPAHRRLAGENFPGLAEINRQAYEAACRANTANTLDANSELPDTAPMTHNGAPVTFREEQVLLRRKP